MRITPRKGVRTVGVILYGLVAGLAGFTVIVLGQILVAFLGVWIFHHLGWEQASAWAAKFGFYYIFFVVVGLIAGIIICLRVWINGARR